MANSLRPSSRRGPKAEGKLADCNWVQLDGDNENVTMMRPRGVYVGVRESEIDPLDADDEDLVEAAMYLVRGRSYG